MTPVMMPVMMSPTRRTTSASSAAPKARTMAPVVSGWRWSDAVPRDSTSTTRAAGVSPTGGRASRRPASASISSTIASRSRRSFDVKYLYTVPRATFASVATSRICTASNPPRSARRRAASSTRRRRAAWLRASAVPGAGPSLVAGVDTAKVKHVPIPAGKHRRRNPWETAGMGTDILDLADRIWRGDADMDVRSLFGLGGELAELGDNRAFVAAFSNVAAFATDDGTVLVDTSSPFLSGRVHDVLTEWRPDPLHTAVYTHGHIDHVFGVERYEADARERGAPAPCVVAHEAVPSRFDRYIETAGYNTQINRRQFGIDRLEWPTEYRYPDETYRAPLTT